MQGFIAAEYPRAMFSKLRNYLRQNWLSPTRQFAAHESEAVELANGTPGALAEIFFSGRGRRIHKWVHYLPTYERYFSAWQGKAPRFLEIGVFGGGSLDMWREYFGADAIIYGIDINSECAGLATPPTQIRIGSQDDSGFLKSIVAEMGGVDLILDDGSHIGKHQRKSFQTLFPLLTEGGVYMIEDTHTSYWPRYSGGYRWRGTAIEFGKRIVDDMHGWYHHRRMLTEARDQVGAIHFHDSIIVVEKQARARPKHIIVEQNA